MDFQALRRTFEEQGQGHVFAHWETLGEADRATLADDCARVDFVWLAERKRQIAGAAASATAPKPTLTPAPVVTLPATDEDRAARKKAVARGVKAFKAGKVAAFLVAGGQGSRLGYDGPKGCYAVGPVSGKTLFQWHAEKILAASRRYGAPVPWYLMTSRLNDAATREYFERNDYLGLGKENVFFFQQAVVPSVDLEGKLILADPGHLAMNPDGHGGSLAALVKSGAVADMKKRGIETLSYFQVDNPLVPIADPAFVGFHLLAKADMSSKVLDKAYPEEKVGHLCYADGTLSIIEYSDMDPADMRATDAGGRLKYWAGSIAIHMFAVDFIANIGGAARLPWHVAHKKIPYWQDGREVKPDTPNGVKFETFVFDALPLARKSVSLEVERAEEFAPVKNATGVDSAESCRQLLSNRFARWLAAAGATLPAPAANGDTPASIEISPLYAEDAKELAKKTGHRLTVENVLALG